MSTDTISAGARQFERHSTQFEARLEPHPDHVDQFRLSFAAGNAGLPVVDVSAGGLALKTGFFIPKNMRFVLILSHGANPALNEELSIKVVTRRCVTVDHKPTFQIGMQFLEPHGNDEKKLVRSVLASQEHGSGPPAKREAAGVA